MADMLSDFKVRLLSSAEPSEMVTFLNSPTVHVSAPVDYTSVAPIHMPGATQFYKNTSPRTFSISVDLVSKNSAEASYNQHLLHQLNCWRYPWFGYGTLMHSGAQVTDSIDNGSLSLTSISGLGSLTSLGKSAFDSISNIFKSSDSELNSFGMPKSIDDQLFKFDKVASSSGSATNRWGMPKSVDTQLFGGRSINISALGRSGIQSMNMNASAPGSVSGSWGTPSAIPINPPSSDVVHPGTSNKGGSTPWYSGIQNSWEVAKGKASSVIDSITGRGGTSGGAGASGSWGTTGGIAGPISSAGGVSTNSSSGTTVRQVENVIGTTVDNLLDMGSSGGPSNGMLGAPPPVLFLYAYSPMSNSNRAHPAKNLNRIPVVVSNLDYTYPNDVDYIPTETMEAWPIKISVSITLIESRSPVDLEGFSLQAYKMGALPNF